MWHKVNTTIERAIARIRLPFRGVVTMVRSDTNVQLVQGIGLAGEQLQDAELFQHYGFTSHPPEGAMFVMTPVGGRTAHGIIIATEHGSYRLKQLAPGEMAIYSDEGDSIILKRGRVIDVTTQTLNIKATTAVNIDTQTMTINASSAVNANTPVVQASQNLTVTGVTASNGGLTAKASASGGPAAAIQGSISVTDDVVANGRSLVNHDHKDSLGGITSAPLPVG